MVLDGNRKMRQIMNTKKIFVMALALTTATCVFARGHHHHHHHGGLGLAAGIVGLTAATVSLAHDIVAPDPVVVAQPTVVAPAPAVVAQPVVVAPQPAVYPAPVVYPRRYHRPYHYRRW